MDLVHLLKAFFPDIPVPVEVHIRILEDHEISDGLVIIASSRKVVAVFVSVTDFGIYFQFV